MFVLVDMDIRGLGHLGEEMGEQMGVHVYVWVAVWVW